MKRILKFLGIIFLLLCFEIFSELLAAKIIEIYEQIENETLNIKYHLLLGQVISGIFVIPIIYKRSRKTPYIKLSVKKDFWKMLVIGFGVFFLWKYYCKYFIILLKRSSIYNKDFGNSWWSLKLIKWIFLNFYCHSNFSSNNRRTYFSRDFVWGNQ